MSKKGDGGGASPQAEAYAQQMAAIGQDIWGMARPSYASLANRYSNFLSSPGQFDYTQSPMWSAGKSATESGYQNAMQNILANLPAGGPINQSMTSLERGRAQNLTNLASNAAQDEYNKAYGFATGQPQVGLSGIGGASTSMTSLAGQQAAAEAQGSAGKFGALGNLGMGVGSYLGGK